MNLLDKYIHAIGKHLPAKSRQDIQAEIRSTLEDMIEDRSQARGQPADETLVAEVLKEYGAPQKVAAAYHKQAYLIGPRLYPTYMLVLRIVLIVIFVLSLVGFGVSFAENAASGEAFLRALGKSFLQLLSGVITAFGNVTLVFAILERTLPAEEWEKEVTEWNPASLEAEPDPDQVNVGELIVTIIFILAGLVIFNLYPGIVGIGFQENGKWVFAPMLSEAFFHYLPWINLLGVLEILLSLFLLRKGSWNTISRLCHLALEIGGIILTIAMLVGPSLVSFPAESVAGTPLEGIGNTLQPLLNFVPTIILVILIVLQSIEVVQILYRLWMGRPAKPWLPKKA